MHSAPVTAARVVDAVNAVLQRDLAISGSDTGSVEHLLTVCDVLMHRAILDETREARRLRAAPRLADLAAAVLDRSDASEIYGRIEDASTIVAAAAESSDAVEQILRILAETDLPELGRATVPDRDVAEVAAMDWLGRDAVPEVGAELIQQYLIEHRAEDGPRAVRSVRRLSGGFSKVTLLVAADGKDGPEEIVLRQLQRGRGDARGLAAEFAVVRFAWAHDVAAPEPLWAELDEGLLGGAFFATRRAAGSNLGDVFGPRPGTSPEVGLGLARELAHLHRLDPGPLTAAPVPPMRTRAEILGQVDDCAEQVAAAAAVDGNTAHPLHALLFGWLRANAPEDVARPVLLHGDPGFHNLLVADGVVQALLDWERARVGDAAQDLAYVRPHVTRVQPWEQFLEAYCAAGGEAPDEMRIRYYSVWHDAWRYGGSYRGRSRLLTQPRSMLDAVMGLLHAPRFLLSGLCTAYGVDL
jgi:aminoglycoside phosphotransferase (APT) family kinase protein